MSAAKTFIFENVEQSHLIAMQSRLSAWNMNWAWVNKDNGKQAIEAEKTEFNFPITVYTNDEFELHAEYGQDSKQLRLTVMKGEAHKIIDALRPLLISQ